MKHGLAMIGLGLLVAGVAHAGPQPGEEFMQSAVEGSLGEIATGRLAVERASTIQVRQLGQVMVSDHAKALAAGSAVSTELGFRVPQEPGKDEKALYNNLTALKGLKFDLAYVDAMKDEHEKTIDKFSEEADRKQGLTSDFASSTLPVLRHHLELVKAAEKALAK